MFLKVFRAFGVFLKVFFWRRSPSRNPPTERAVPGPKGLNSGHRSTVSLCEATTEAKVSADTKTARIIFSKSSDWKGVARSH